jgi:hypothetical protein
MLRRGIAGSIKDGRVSKLKGMLDLFGCLWKTVGGAIYFMVWLEWIGLGSKVDVVCEECRGGGAGPFMYCYYYT